MTDVAKLKLEVDADEAMQALAATEASLERIQAMNEAFMEAQKHNSEVKQDWLKSLIREVLLEEGVVEGGPRPASFHTQEDGLGRRRVYLDGVEVEYALECDTGEGWVTHQVTDESGDFVTEGNDIKTETLYGDVRVEFVGVSGGEL